MKMQPTWGDSCKGIFKAPREIYILLCGSA